jgi:hypothetical protein
MDSLISQWNTYRRTTSLPTRLLMRILELLLLTAAFYILPTFLHHIVQSIDDLYDILGRTARSPYTAVSGVSVGVGILVVLGWHVWLGRLGYKAMLDGGKEGVGRTGSWGRVLGRVVMPVFLVVFGIQFGYQVLRRWVIWGRLLLGIKRNCKAVLDRNGMEKHFLGTRICPAPFCISLVYLDLGFEHRACKLRIPAPNIFSS